MEIWRPITITDDYEVSNKGRLRSLKYGKKRIMKLATDACGYYRCTLTFNGNKSTIKVHREVAKAFIMDCSLCVNHKNGIKTDNRVSNLEFVSHSENLKHSYDIGIRCHRGEKNSKTTLTNEQVLGIKTLLETGELRQSEIAKMFKVSKYVVSNIKLRKTWSHIEPQQRKEK